MAMKALSTAFLMWQGEQARLHLAGEQTTWNLDSRKLKALHRNKLIVFVGPARPSPVNQCPWGP
jgi:hypothetical protein